MVKDTKYHKPQVSLFTQCTKYIHTTTSHKLVHLSKIVVVAKALVYVNRETDKILVELGVYPWKFKLLSICIYYLGIFVYFLYNINYFDWVSIKSYAFCYPLFEI